MIAVIEKLRQVAGDLERKTPVAIEDTRIIAAVLAVLELNGKPGERLDCTKAAMAERNQLLRQVAKKFPGVNELSKAWKAYELRSWPRTREAAGCPHPQDSAPALFWRMLKVKSSALGPKMIGGILDGNKL